MGVKNYVFKAYAPEDEGDLEVFDAMLRRNAEMYNAMIVPWQTAQDDEYALCRRLSPAVKKLDKQIDKLSERREALIEEIKSERVLQRTQNPKGIEVLEDEKGEVSKRSKELREERQRVCKEVRSSEEYNTAKKEIKAKQEDSHFRIHHHSYAGEPGNYNKTISSGDRAAIIASVSKAFFSKKRKRYLPMRDKRGSDFREGSVCVSIGTKSIPVGDLLNGSNSRIKLVPSDREEITYSNGRTITSSRKWHDCLFELYDNGPRRVWFRVRVSNEMPEDGVIAFAYFTRYFIADKPQYSIMITVRTPPEVNEDRDEKRWFAARPTFRRVGEGGKERLIIADCKDHTGDRWTIELPERCIEVNERARLIQSKRDNELVEVRTLMGDWARDRHDAKLPLPELVEGKRGYFHKCSPARMTAIVRSWANDRVDGDDELFDRMHDEWLPQDKKMWREQKYAESKVANIRRDHFRKEAHELSLEYDVAIIASNDLTDKKTAKGDGDEDDMDDVTRRCKRLAAPGTLRQFIGEKFAEGCVSFELPNTDSKCSQCHKTSKKTKMKKNVVTCSPCGAEIGRVENSLEILAFEGVKRINKGVIADGAQKVFDDERKRVEKLKKNQEAKRSKSAAKKGIDQPRAIVATKGTITGSRSQARKTRKKTRKPQEKATQSDLKIVF